MCRCKGKHVVFVQYVDSPAGLSSLLNIAVVTVKTTSPALLLMVCVLPVNPAGMVHDVIDRAQLVTMVTAAGRLVHDVGAMSPVTQKLGNVGHAILGGLEPGVYECVMHT